MTGSADYLPETLTRAGAEALAGVVLLDFGTDWCGYCRAARPLVERALSAHPGIRHLRIEDGRGRPLGRAYGVRLWPTLVLLRDGAEAGRATRPRSVAEVEALLSAADAAPG